MTTKERIHKAVSNQEWQIFRISLKGKTTERKLQLLKEYFEEKVSGDCLDGTDSYDDVCIRVDNYIKALCRGGQLYAGESLETALSTNWNLLVKK